MSALISFITGMSITCLLLSIDKWWKDRQFDKWFVVICNEVEMEQATNTKPHRAEGGSSMIVKIAPLGERVVEVNVDEGCTIGKALEIAGVIENGRSIQLNNETADVDTAMTSQSNIVTLAQKMKGGKL